MEKIKKIKIKLNTRYGKFGREMYVSSNKETGYSAYFQDFPKIGSQGETIKETQQRLWNTVYDTLKYYLHDKEKSK